MVWMLLCDPWLSKTTSYAAMVASETAIGAFMSFDQLNNRSSNAVELLEAKGYRSPLATTATQLQTLHSS
jgi:hypothetical protein